ncbi:uncharacterized protein LOC115756429 [Rhodamnia argentea]|uniref:Uncharacterized protein LOC115756429 n=1 Tax=Rhodamnia argentea TaxID=178133 RepID=A0A8B8QYA8_9MYRT|nr:uncharacterized protein LOC115756429 [Rhodamnia argentea]
MGNCQAIDAAALVIQHPDGRLERMYWPVAASEVMRTNPGHYVSLIIPLPGPGDERKESDRQDPPPKAAVRFTRVKLLRPTETLALGHAYRLITSQEVMKVLKAKKYGKTKQRQQQSGAAEKANAGVAKDESSDMDAISKVSKRGIQRSRLAAAGGVAVGRSKSWRPSLQSIDECGSR